jgi:hypothetical protein
MACALAKKNFAAAPNSLASLENQAKTASESEFGARIGGGSAGTLARIGGNSARSCGGFRPESR